MVDDWSSAAGHLGLRVCTVSQSSERVLMVCPRRSICSIDFTWWQRMGRRCPLLSPVGIMCSRVCKLLSLVVARGHTCEMRRQPPVRWQPSGTVRVHRCPDSYLVDPASSHMLVSKTKPCMSKYKRFYTVKLRMAH